MTDILRNLEGELMGLDAQNNLVTRGKRIVLNHNATPNGERTLEIDASGRLLVNGSPVSGGGYATLTSDSYAFIGDGTTDNGAIYNAMILAGETLRLLGVAVTLIFKPNLTGSLFATTLKHAINGDINVEWKGVTVYATGTDDTNPLFTHGTQGAKGSGYWKGYKARNIVTHSYYNRNHIAIRFLNKNWCQEDTIGYIEGFVIGIQYQAYSNSCAYNVLNLGRVFVCQTALEFQMASNDAGSFVAENKVYGGDVELTSSFNNLGNAQGMAVTRCYDTGYANSSANWWDKPCIQNPATARSWASTTSQTAGWRLHAALTGSEFLVKTGGTTGSTEPSVIPSGANLVSLTSITTVAGSAQVLVSSTTGISAGWHSRWMNPLDNFPLDTYVVSVDDATHLTLSHTAAIASTTAKAHFTAPITDGSCTLIYLGPFRRPALWMRDSGTSSGIVNGRGEGGYGEQTFLTGAHPFPESSSSAGSYVCDIHTSIPVAVKICRFPKWAANTAYVVGDCVVRATPAGAFWDCAVAGTSHATTEPTPATNNDYLVIVDNGVTWIQRTLNDTSNSDIGICTGGIHNFKGSVGSPFEVVTDSVVIDNLVARTTISATGARVVGCSRSGTGGTATTDFSTGTFGFARDGLILNSSTEVLGTVIKVDQQKCIRVRKSFFPDYKSSRLYIICLDQNLNRLPISANQIAYHTRVHGNLSTNAGNSVNEPNDLSGDTVNLLFSAEVKAAFIGFAKGSNPCILRGFAFGARKFKGDSSNGLVDGTIQLINPYAPDKRNSLSTPTSVLLQRSGVFIDNGSVVTGNTTPKGWWGLAFGFLIPAWGTSTAYIKGQLVSQGGNVYAANGRFTSGTAPSGTSTTTPVTDGTATSITSGDNASWSYLGAIGTINTDENLA